MLFNYLYKSLSIENFRKRIWVALLLGFLACATAIFLSIWFFQHQITDKVSGAKQSFWELLMK